MIKLGQVYTGMHKTFAVVNEAQDDKYSHIGYGRYKLKGKENDKGAETFTKDDRGNYVATKQSTPANTDEPAVDTTPKVNIFDKPEPKSTEQPKPQPKQVDSTGGRTGNPKINKLTRAVAAKAGITQDKLGKDEYKTSMIQATVAALTDMNMHQEARELIADLEGKPEWKQKPDYPSVSDPDFKSKMSVIRTNSTDASDYSKPDDNIRKFSNAITKASNWEPADALDGIAFDLKMNGFLKLAAKIQSLTESVQSTKLTKLL